MKKFKTPLIVALFVFVGLFLMKDFLIKNIVMSVASNAMGASVSTL